MCAEQFCEDCPFIEVYREQEEFWGAPCYRTEVECERADFDPMDKHCPRHDDFMDELTEEEMIDLGLLEVEDDDE